MAILVWAFLPALVRLMVHLLWLKGNVDEARSEVSAWLLIILLMTTIIWLGIRAVQHEDRSRTECGLRCLTCQLELTGMPGMIAVAAGYGGRCGALVYMGDGPPSRAPKTEN